MNSSFLKVTFLSIFTFVILGWIYIHMNSPARVDSDVNYKSMQLPADLLTDVHLPAATKSLNKLSASKNMSTPIADPKLFGSHVGTESNMELVGDGETIQTQVTDDVQEQIDYIAANLDIRLEALSNFRGTGKLTLTNFGDRIIEKALRIGSGGSRVWNLYVSMMPYFGGGPSGSSLLGDNDQFKTSHADGRVWILTPSNKFDPLGPGDSMDLFFGYGGVIAAKSDVFPNWYITTEGSVPRIIESTKGESLSFIANFTDRAQWKRGIRDSYDPFTPEVRYDRNSDVQDLGDMDHTFLPTPYKITTVHGLFLDFSDTREWKIITDHPNMLKNEIQLLQDWSGIEFTKNKSKRKHISIMCGPVSIGEESLNKSDDKYSISMSHDPHVINITAPRASGVYYAIRTLMMMINKNQKIPVCHIIDAPRFSYRGLMLDVARNFLDKRSVLQLIDSMSLYKLNKLHLHLTDDQGWRLQIPGLPELTEIGGRRGHDLEEKHHLFAFDGSGPFTNSSGSGFYTVSDFTEILKHAANNHIQIIPEFDMPGHSHAAAVSMKVRQGKLLASGASKQEAEEFLLTDPLDRPNYSALGSFRISAINPCMESTYKFTDKLISEVAKMFKGIAPFHVIHMGGDEVPNNAYKNSPLCADLKRQYPELKSDSDLKFYFIKRVSLIAAKMKLKLQLWEDGLLKHGTSIMAKLPGLTYGNIISNSWQNNWREGQGKRAYIQANRGAQVVLGHATHLYFDHPQEPDPEERGLYWATRFSDTKRTFRYMPESVYDNMDFDSNGVPLNKESVCRKSRYECPVLNKPENIIGMQGALWTEVVRTPEQMFSQLFPRSIALAERAWHKADWENDPNPKTRETLRAKDFERFANIVGHQELCRLQNPEYFTSRRFMKPVKYYLHPPGAKLQVTGDLGVNVCFPGTTVQYFNASSYAWSDITGTGFKYPGGEVLLRVRGCGSDEFTSRNVTVNFNRKGRWSRAFFSRF